MSESEWRPIATVPRDGTPVIFADFHGMCLMALAPHVWSGRYFGDEMYECSYAATNENGEPTHWMPQPEMPAEVPGWFAAPPTPAAASGTPTGGPA